MVQPQLVHHSGLSATMAKWWNASFTQPGLIFSRHARLKECLNSSRRPSTEPLALLWVLMAPLRTKSRAIEVNSEKSNPNQSK